MLSIRGQVELLHLHLRIHLLPGGHIRFVLVHALGCRNLLGQGIRHHLAEMESQAGAVLDTDASP